MDEEVLVDVTFDVDLICKCGHKLNFYDGYYGFDCSDPISRICPECSRKWVVTVYSVEISHVDQS